MSMLKSHSHSHTVVLFQSLIHSLSTCWTTFVFMYICSNTNEVIFYINVFLTKLLSAPFPVFSVHTAGSQLKISSWAYNSLFNSLLATYQLGVTTCQQIDLQETCRLVVNLLTCCQLVNLLATCNLQYWFCSLQLAGRDWALDPDWYTGTWD